MTTTTKPADVIDRPAGSPQGECRVCGDATSPKREFALTGVYSVYPLCLNTWECDQRAGERQAAERPQEPSGDQDDGEDAPEPPVPAEDAPEPALDEAACGD